MKPLRIFLIDSKDDYKMLLEKKLMHTNSIKFSVTFAEVKNAERLFEDNATQIDIVLFGENIPSGVIVKLSKYFRSRNAIIPIFLLTRQSETHIPRKYKEAGVDDFINVEEIETPLFSWTFMSSVEHAVLRKKAKEYDTLHNLMKNINQSLAFLMHEINNPLSVIRLAMYHLENHELPIEKREIFFKILVTSLAKVDSQMKELRTIRRQLSDETNHPKILSVKSATSTAVAQ